MDTNAQNTLVIIFQHVDIFCTMLDHYSDKSKSIVGFKISAYDNVLDNYLEKHIPDKKDRRRCRVALDIKNMEECGLLSFIDGRRGQFGLQRGLLSTIQGLDSKRIRELGQPDLDIIYVQMKKLYDYFMPKGGAYDPGDVVFQENLSTLMDVLQDVLGKIDHNVKALEGSSKRLSEILESHDFNAMIMSDQVRDALDEIIRISKRNILPTLTFLNEKAMAEDASAMFIIRRIKESFERTSFHNELANISTIEMRLLSFAEVISNVRRRLIHYVEMDSRQREIYNSIEARFNELYTKVVSGLDSKLTGKRISPDDNIFYPARSMVGLNNWKHNRLNRALIEMPDDAGDDYVLEYIRTKLDEAESIRGNKRKPAQQTMTAKERLEKAQRLSRIKEAMQSFSSGEAQTDLYKSVHDHLVKTLPGYVIPDMFDGVFMVGENMIIKGTLEKGVIIHNSKKLTYTVRRLEAA